MANLTLAADSKSLLSGNETNSILNILYQWVSGIEGLPTKMLLDEVKAVPPCITFALTAPAYKENYNVVGAYDGVFPFTIYYKIAGNGTNVRVSAVDTLNSISAFFDASTADNTLPDIGDRDIPVSAGMTSAPAFTAAEDNGSQVYSASFEFRYRHKSKYE